MTTTATTTGAAEGAVDEVEALRRAVLEVYAAVNSHDAAAIDARWGDGPSTSMVGTDEDEWFVGGDAVRACFARQFEHFGDLVFEAGDVECHVRGDVGWWLDRGVVVAGEHRTPLRLTGTAVRDGGSWRMVQTHLSIGAPSSMG